VCGWWVAGRGGAAQSFVDTASMSGVKRGRGRAAGGAGGGGGGGGCTKFAERRWRETPLTPLTVCCCCRYEQVGKVHLRVLCAIPAAGMVKTC
jgi:hypothetical protein